MHDIIRFCQEKTTAKEQTLQQFNSSYINSLLSKCNGNVTPAAKLCGLERQALQQIMRRYGIKAEPFRKHAANEEIS